MPIFLLAIFALSPLAPRAYTAPPQKDNTPIPDKIDFERDIRAVLSNNCFACHGPDKKHRKAKLRLDTKAGLFTENDGITPVVPGKFDKSELYARITAKDPDDLMPPKKSGKELTARQIALFKKWIEQGAPWQGHWAYQPLARSAAPTISKNKTWPINVIDRFILARLDAEKLSPSAQADKHTLVRRLYFDIIGLPPTSKQVSAFINDKSPKAYEKLVDQLLASPHYGERMAIHWLDLVRYADTVGYHGDQDHNISPYRDYVIKAFNENMPYDQFTVEQLAGDLLPNATMWQKIASGYNRLLQTTHEGGAQDKEYLAIYAADRVRNLSSVWMGATVGCAQCHNHKYDPYTQVDFYSLAAFFADVQEKGAYGGANSIPTKRPPEMRAWNIEQAQQFEYLDKQIAALSKAKPQNADSKKKIAALEKQKKDLAKKFQMSMITVAVKPRTMRVLARGDWMDDSGPVVTPKTPAFLPALKIKANTRATRLDLARWFTSRPNPLTARVFVNRVWKLFYGKGISARLDDLGAQGEAPVHPKLLDTLAVEFVESGWNIKHIIKLMVMSRTYQQSSVATLSKQRILDQRDPDNRLLARQSRWRLEAEMIRDNALAVSGLLITKLGGRSTKPYQPAGYYKHLNFPTRKYRADDDENQYRRGVYTHWQRIFLHPMLRAFDAPTREECTAVRPVSNTPAAALVLLNDPSFVEAARALAVATVKNGGKSIDTRLTYIWKQTLGRSPDRAELAVLRNLYQQDLREYKADAKAADQLLTIGLYRAPKEIDRAELAAWTSIARAMLNLNETITRN